MEFETGLAGLLPLPGMRMRGSPAVDRRPVIAGIALAVLYRKPHQALLVPGVLAASRRWPAFAAAGATSLVLPGSSAWLCGIEAWPASLSALL